MYQRASTRFGNCTRCSRYQRLDYEGICNHCINEELELVEAAQLLLKCNPYLTSAEIAEGLKIKVNRIEAWIRQGRLRCSILRSRCPACGNQVRQFFCTQCGMDVRDSLEKNAREEKKLVREILEREMNSYKYKLSKERIVKRVSPLRTDKFQAGVKK